MHLYTDGITEAREESHQEQQHTGRMFGTEKLKEILGQQKDPSTENTKNNLLDALVGYKENDDVTLVILRRL